MPLVGMRRSTRVFVAKTKDGDGVRVLRSGRRLWVGADGVDLFRLIQKSDDALGFFSKGISLRYKFVHDRELDPMEVEFENAEPQLEKRELPSASMEVGCRFGAVYSRKRKRSDLRSSDRMSGLHYVRRKRGKTLKRLSYLEDCGLGGVREDDGFLYVTVDSSIAESCRFSGVINSVLRRMCMAKVELFAMALFFMLPPVGGVFGSCGIHFLMNHPSNMGSGFCKIYGARDFTPLFDINFLAAPLCFFHLHAEMWLRSLRLSSVLMSNDGRDKDHSNLIDQGDHNPRDSKTLAIPSGVSRSPHNLAPVSTRDGRKSRKRSLKTRRARNPSSLILHKASGSSVPSSSIRKHAVAQKRSSTSDIRLLKSNLAAMGKGMDSVSCSANLLMFESDRCYRESGALVKLELSASKEWVLAVRKDGSLRFCHKARNDKEVKPYSTNRFTYAILWGVENGWKLEFPERKDWMIFKELFKVCGERNLVRPSEAIPIPGLFEVSAFGVTLEDPFFRPESYIRMEGNELSRALAKGTANYDMDADDEEWLDKENHVTEEAFESIIFEFEKAVFLGSCDFTDEIALINRCVRQYRREVVEAVYRHWMKKREQNNAPLLSIFKLYKPEDASSAKKPVPRKKRSIKQGDATAKATPSGRGKQIGALRALYSKKNLMGPDDPDNAGAAAAAKRASEIATAKRETAIAKRERARRLAEFADLAVYRATMAVRIAEAAQSASRPEQVIAHLLD